MVNGCEQGTDDIVTVIDLVLRAGFSVGFVLVEGDPMNVLM